MLKTSISAAVSILGLALAVASCARPTIPDSPTAALTSTAPIAVAAASPTPSLLPTLIPVVSSPTPPAITVSAFNGNVFIRRGPDMAFDPVGVLMDGQNAQALARDVLEKWVQIPIPGKAGRTGWISLQTHFITVTGDIRKLPETTPTEWPLGASLRNCTHHEMKADPGSIFIPPLELFPDNEVQINPGIYTIYDTSLDNGPQVMKVEIREGSQIDIRTDGGGNRHKCPTP